MPAGETVNLRSHVEDCLAAVRGLYSLYQCQLIQYASSVSLPRLKRNSVNLWDGGPRALSSRSRHDVGRLAGVNKHGYDGDGFKTSHGIPSVIVGAVLGVVQIPPRQWPLGHTTFGVLPMPDQPRWTI